MKNYIGIIQEENKQFGIIFPDFPGCVSVGDTIEEVYKNGIEALSLHINGMKEDSKDNIPEPSNLKTIKHKINVIGIIWIILLLCLFHI